MHVAKEAKAEDEEKRREKQRQAGHILVKNDLLLRLI